MAVFALIERIRGLTTGLTGPVGSLTRLVGLAAVCGMQAAVPTLAQAVDPVTAGVRLAQTLGVDLTPAQAAHRATVVVHGRVSGRGGTLDRPGSHVWIVTVTRRFKGDADARVRVTSAERTVPLPLGAGQEVVLFLGPPRTIDGGTVHPVMTRTLTAPLALKVAADGRLTPLVRGLTPAWSRLTLDDVAGLAAQPPPTAPPTD